MEKILKGEGFLNRYRFTGTLKILTPLHIGTGEGSTEFYSEEEREQIREKIGKLPEVSTIIRDFNKKPLIPGSSLRGVMRHWLLNVLRGFGSQWADDRDYEDAALTELNQEEQIERVKGFSWLELLFGTPFHEGKVEIWDASCQTEEMDTDDTLLGWNSKTLTYIDTSVAIDPTTGTALENLLYKTEIVPPGVEFAFNLVGQNLTDLEIGLILLALQGFNSDIYPIHVGSRSARGYGRMEFIPGSVYGLTTDDLGSWVSSEVEKFQAEDDSREAGYFALPQLSEEQQEHLIQNAKSTFINQMGE